MKKLYIVRTSFNHYICEKIPYLLATNSYCSRCKTIYRDDSWRLDHLSCGSFKLVEWIFLDMINIDLEVGEYAILEVK